MAGAMSAGGIEIAVPVARNGIKAARSRNQSIKSNIDAGDDNSKKTLCVGAVNKVIGTSGKCRN